jgi:hypothetical protein
MEKPKEQESGGDVSKPSEDTSTSSTTSSQSESSNSTDKK